VTTPRTGHSDFEALEASQLFCPTCKRAMPVRKRLFLVLLDKEIFDYICTSCGSAVGKKEQPWQGTGAVVEKLTGGATVNPNRPAARHKRR